MHDKSILVVEDDDSIRNTLKLLFEDEGYQVFTACNGRDGITVLKNHDRPSLIVLDLMMPIMTGWEFLQVRNQELGLEDIPVIALSASSQSEIPMGADAYLRKPFDVDGLVNLAHRFTGRIPPTPAAVASVRIA